MVLGAVHLTQGTADLGVGDLLRALTGADDGTTAVVLASRVPRLVAAVIVGTALGVAGTILQSVARNPLASPDTLAVNAGAYVALVAVAALGLTVPFYLQGTLALLGGLAATATVLLLARGAGPTRLVLAGSAIALALHALTTLLLVLFAQETTGLFAWGSGSIVQSGPRVVTLAAPVLLVALAAAGALAGRLDLLALGDDAGAVLGLPVRRVRLTAVVVAAALAALAVTVAGPVGFVGLAAPVIARLLARRVPGLGRHALLLPFAALLGVGIVLAADVLLRLVVGPSTAIAVPTGVVTTLAGAGMLVWVARGAVGGVAEATWGRLRSATTFRVVLGGLLVAVLAAGVAGLLLGDRLVLLGDVANWWNGVAGRGVDLVLDQRFPRVLVAPLAGAGLALAGTVVQAVCRNPLAEPGLLGVSSGAGLGAVLVTLLAPGAGMWPMMAAAATGALLAFVAVLVLARGRRGTPGRGGDRIVLVGIGAQAGIGALITLVVVAIAPWNVTQALTWLAGSTYGRTLDHAVPVTIALAIAVPIVWTARRELDLLALDDDVPRILGIPVDRARPLLLAVAALVTAAAVCAVGVVGFVGLVAPHAARALVGSRHARVLPVAMLLGALCVSVADTLGRTVIAPAQVPAGVAVALLGAPYFVWLLWRRR